MDDDEQPGRGYTDADRRLRFVLSAVIVGICFAFVGIYGPRVLAGDPPDRSPASIMFLVGGAVGPVLVAVDHLQEYRSRRRDGDND